MLQKAVDNLVIAIEDGGDVDGTGTGLGGTGGDGSADIGAEVGVVHIPANWPSVSNASGLVSLVEVGDKEASPLFAWSGSEEAERAQDAAWGKEKGKKSERCKGSKKLSSFYAAYSIVKLALHWETIEADDDINLAELKNAASGAFVAGSSQAQKAAKYLNGRALSSELLLGAGSYRELALKVRGHVEGCGNGLQCMQPDQLDQEV